MSNPHHVEDARYVLGRRHMAILVGGIARLQHDKLENQDAQNQPHAPHDLPIDVERNSNLTPRLQIPQPVRTPHQVLVFPDRRRRSVSSKDRWASGIVVGVPPGYPIIVPLTTIM